MRDYATIKSLKAGDTVELEGCLWEKLDGDIQPGDWYIAERNTPPRLLTAKEIITEKGGPFVVPEEIAYCYDLHECVRVKEVVS